MKIEPFGPQHVPLVKDLNDRLRNGGVSHQLGVEPNAASGRQGPVIHENYLALEGNFVRGGYTLIRQNALVAGRPQQLAFLQIPLSEGIIERKYAAVGLLLLKDAMRRAPLLFGLGMGGFGQPLPKLFKILGAHVVEVPFYVRVQNARAVLRNLRALQASRFRRVASGLLGWSGLGQLGALAFHGARSWNRPGAHSYTVDRDTEFGSWIDEIWQGSSSNYSMIVVRDREALAYWYTGRADWLHLLCVRKDGRPVGWAVVGDAVLHGHNHLGDARLGSVVDCLALPGHEPKVVSAATSYLARRGVDLIISNQSHPAWCAALDRSGYVKAPSNYLFAAAPALREAIAAGDPSIESVHVTRGDGDAAYNLS